MLCLLLTIPRPNAVGLYILHVAQTNTAENITSSHTGLIFKEQTTKYYQNFEMFLHFKKPTYIAVT